MGDGQILLKPRHTTIPLIKSYRMSLISAASISLDSTFKSIYSNYIVNRCPVPEYKKSIWMANVRQTYQNFTTVIN